MGTETHEHPQQMEVHWNKMNLAAQEIKTFLIGYDQGKYKIICNPIPASRERTYTEEQERTYNAVYARYVGC